MLLLGKQRFANVDIRIRAQGGGHVSQIYGAGLATSLDQLNACLLVHGKSASAMCNVADISLNDAAIRQAIAKGLVAFYQKCESLSYRNYCLRDAGPAALCMCACLSC